MTNTTLGKVKRTIQELKKLEEFSLSFGPNSWHPGKGITLAGLNYLSQALKNSQNIKKLSFVFDG